MAPWDFTEVWGALEVSEFEGGLQLRVVKRTTQMTNTFMFSPIE
jgi:hypothetical protein